MVTMRKISTLRKKRKKKEVIFSHQSTLLQTHFSNLGVEITFLV